MLNALVAVVNPIWETLSGKARKGTWPTDTRIAALLEQRAQQLGASIRAGLRRRHRGSFTQYDPVVANEHSKAKSFCCDNGGALDHAQHIAAHESPRDEIAPIGAAVS